MTSFFFKKPDDTRRFGSHQVSDDFMLSVKSRKALEVVQPPMLWLLVSFYLVVKWSERVSYHSPPSNIY
jgi:hypothetical protein